MNNLKRTFAALLSITVATSGVAFAQFAPPPGGPPSLPLGGPPRLSMGGMPRPPSGMPRPQMGGHIRPPVQAQNRPPVDHRPTHAPGVGGAKRRLAEGPGRGGNNLSGNIRNTLNSGGNISGNRAFMNSGGNIIAKDSGNLR